MELDDLKPYVGKKCEAWITVTNCNGGKNKTCFDGEIHGTLALENNEYHVVCEKGYCWIRIYQIEDAHVNQLGTLIIHLKG